MISFQGVISKLQGFWGSHGCVQLQGYDMPVGAGTFSPYTLLKALRRSDWRAVYVQPSRRPTDGRYADNPNRVYKHHQFQAVLTPSPANIQELYLQSLAELGISQKQHDIRFVEDDWETPALGAAGLGWEVWCDGMEITQFTYFQQVGGIQCPQVMAEITYGLERLSMFLQSVDNVYDLLWSTDGGRFVTYGDVRRQEEQEFSAYCLECANVQILKRHFEDAEEECKSLIAKDLPLPAYEQCIKASDTFNLLDARGALSVVERAQRISRIRALAQACCEKYVEIVGE